MTDEATSESEQRSWHGLQKKAVRLVIERKTSDAISLVTDFLTDARDPGVRRSALSFRGDLNRDAGKKDAAKEDYMAALASGGTTRYERYSIEVAIAGIAQSLGDMEEATEWYRRALLTAEQEPDQTGATALRGLASMNRQLNPGDEDLCARVARKAWTAAGLAGEPDLAALAETAEKIIRAPSGGGVQ